MTDERDSPDADLSAQLSGIAARLIDVAGCVASEAEAASILVRGMTDHASRVASLAFGLEAAASTMEAAVRRQADALAIARAELAANKPVIDALEQSIAGVSSISAAIAEVAQESRILSLNARIEAARAGVDGAAFGVVAAEMSGLAIRTKTAADDIVVRSSRITTDLDATNGTVASYSIMLVEQNGVLEATLNDAMRQRSTAAELAMITTETEDTVDQAATAIGRVGANAVAVKVLARQISKLSRSARTAPSQSLAMAD
ncbi:hypothetical protein KZ810_03330 [Sphingomonas sp. RHCKR47]|uniref:methyl-accepting chemotaxis protein n=1 Tax=Sphingomonas citricola TaxID=2862498 RepID=UPI001C934E32|nr:methyl-accepting chemotaxis protein [Sphingomonas citricola]MBW6522519.1 hypothetical protein [Sphingomonas citricola]